MPHLSKTFATLGVLAAAACARAGTQGPASPPAAAGAGVRNLVLMVADGAGVAYWSAAERAEGRLAVEEMPVVGLVTTQDADDRVTDSAAAATAYATGSRTYYRALSVAPDCRALLRADSFALKRNPERCPPLESVFDLAERAGKATGVVTTAVVIDATPAAFVASAPDRYWREHIADQYAAAGLEVILGGGRKYFDGTGRADRRDLLAGMCASAACLASPADLEAYRPDDRPLVGLFTDDSLQPAGSRAPTVPQMVRAALARLSRDPEGFVAVFESEGTDDAGHANRPLPVIRAEMLEFDRAVAEALDFARRTPGTLLIVTGDHETGGLSFPEYRVGDTLSAQYTTRNHTDEMVPLFAFGPGAERFVGIRRNDEVGRLLKELVR